MRCPAHRAILAALAAATVALGGPPVAGAAYGPGAELISADYERLEQGDDSTVFAAISGDGRYVVMQSRARNFFGDDDPDPPGQYRAGGLFRFELETRELEKVADGDLFDEDTNEFQRRGASNPSVSENGRFVVFATAEPLLGVDTNDNVDIYVRDMNVPIGDPGALDLVSARDGGDVPASYGPPQFPFPGSNPGADLTRGVAISADGQQVAFRTEAPSDLPASGAPDAPTGQVFLRDRATDTTTLVTRTDPGGAPAGGAVGAAVSADGTTVAWTGANAPAQTEFLGGENDNPQFLYYLWRRVADGPGAPTRRITGLADPDDPACPPGSFTNFDPVSTGPCFGPLSEQEANRADISPHVPVLSPDGYTVAFLTGSGVRPDSPFGAAMDLFLTEMTPGLNRKQATTELTREVINDPESGTALSGLMGAPGGRYLTLSTPRIEFALPALRLIDDSRTVPGLRELYVVDLARREIQRVARATDGGDINSDVQTFATVSNDGEHVAFTSFAGNLFFGDANQRGDAFVATRADDMGPSPPPPEPQGGVVFEPEIGVRAKGNKRGKVLLTVGVPGAGGVTADLTAKAGKPRERRTLATERARATEAGPVEMVLTPVKRYRREVKRRRRISARVEVEFVASSGGERLSGVDGLKLKHGKRKK